MGAAAALDEANRASDAGSQLHVLHHQGHSPSVQRGEIGVFEETSQKALSSFLERQHGLALEPKATCGTRCALGDISHESLEGKLRDDELCVRLVLLDLLEGSLTWLGDSLFDGLVLSSLGSESL